MSYIFSVFQWVFIMADTVSSNSPLFPVSRRRNQRGHAQLAETYCWLISQLIIFTVIIAYMGILQFSFDCSLNTTSFLPCQTGVVWFTEVSGCHDSPCSSLLQVLCHSIFVCYQQFEWRIKCIIFLRMYVCINWSHQSVCRQGLQSTACIRFEHLC